METLLAWLKAQLGSRMTIGAIRSLHGGESPWWIDVTAPDGSACPVVLRCPSSRIGADQIATNAAALTVAERHGLPAPRLIAADLDGRAAGTPASLETVVPGSSTWPAAPSVELLLAAGAAIAQVHTVTLDPRPHLPLRPRPIAVDDFAGDRRIGTMPSTALLRLADERVRAITAPPGPVVFVHGDVWPGNTVVGDGGGVHALIDWKTAGAGHPGVDLGELRKQVAILYGDDDAPGHVLEGWERARGARAGDLAYWDAVAALNTPTECYSPDATLRRDAFLRAAIARL
ncbi:phosphotransferase [Dactylosporangium sp. AC04546]|uniref:phosphotransferase family protein n=1 Tax=Dactylosporangium sp. AC04546 TaxID=2862460 RepID=UPI001EDFC374|nr:phosphotransferase [Dactylosporangium sp. AC04546]WVK79339.1 phosphotransferase [Dactylosporangium sp. AC04546]